MSAYYVYSTLATDMIYPTYLENDINKEISIIDKQILIKGGCGVASKHLVTQKGFVTKITEDDYNVLQKNQTFKLHEKNGFIKVEKEVVKISKITKDMNLEDKSRPMTPDEIKTDESGKSKLVKPRD